MEKPRPLAMHPDSEHRWLRFVGGFLPKLIPKQRDQHSALHSEYLGGERLLGGQQWRLGLSGDGDPHFEYRVLPSEYRGDGRLLGGRQWRLDLSG